jgi:hypothetical protein
MEGRYVSGILWFKDLRTAERNGYKFHDAPKNESYYLVAKGTGRPNELVKLAHAGKNDVIIYG